MVYSKNILLRPHHQTILVANSKRFHEKKIINRHSTGEFCYFVGIQHTMGMLPIEPVVKVLSTYTQLLTTMAFYERVLKRLSLKSQLRSAI